MPCSAAVASTTSGGASGWPRREVAATASSYSRRAADFAAVRSPAGTVASGAWSSALLNGRMTLA